VSNEELAEARRTGQHRAAAIGMAPMTDTERQAFIASMFSEPDDTKK
jgi:hypothetical protein